MKSHKKFNFSYIFLIIFFFIECGSMMAQKKSEKKVEQLSINLTVTDEKSNPISAAAITVGEDEQQVTADQQGNVSFKA